jgi:hypothetical protein
MSPPFGEKWRMLWAFWVSELNASSKLMMAPCDDAKVLGVRQLNADLGFY